MWKDIIHGYKEELTGWCKDSGLTIDLDKLKMPEYSKLPTKEDL